MFLPRLAAGALGLVMLALLPEAPVAVMQAEQQTIEVADAPQFREVIEAAIDPSPERIDPDGLTVIRRLPQVTLDTSGDLTVVLALRDEGSKEQIVAGGQADALAVFHAVYQSQHADQVRTATLVGTYGIARPESNRTRERRIVRAVLSAQRAGQLDWATLRAEQLPEVLDLWWVHPAFSAANGPQEEEVS